MSTIAQQLLGQAIVVPVAPEPQTANRRPRFRQRQVLASRHLPDCAIRL